ncbi:MAG: methionyl-tRNA formyltransferase [Vicinamibacterales bacterium]
MTSTRILFFGSPAFAVPTLAALGAAPDVELVGAVTQPDRPRGRGQKVTAGPVKAWAAARGLPVLQPARLGDHGVREALTALDSDLGVVAAYGKILPPWLLALPRLGMINVHASLLPAYRGAAPVQRAILDGARETGVTIMRVVPELDAGPMLDRVVVPIDDEVTSDVLEARLAEAGATLLVAVVARLQHGGVVETPQDAAQASYAAKITRADAPMLWTRPARALHDQVRGLQPWPRASLACGGRRVIVHRSVVPGRPTAAPPGTVVDAGPAGIDVAAGDGQCLRLLVVQLEGGRPVSAAEFQAGRGLEPGAICQPA